MSNKKTALVTGASSGFGQHTAARLAGIGYRVFGTSRKAQAVSVSSVEMLVLDEVGPGMRVGAAAAGRPP
jgi:NADP-dependent 3-hydroxy acid dehydrogenase YdfG